MKHDVLVVATLLLNAQLVAELKSTRVMRFSTIFRMWWYIVAHCPLRSLNYAHFYIPLCSRSSLRLFFRPVLPWLVQRASNP